MALGTITKVAVDPHVATPQPVAVGDLKMTLTTIVGDSAYATGGTAVTAANLGLGTLIYAVVVGVKGSGSNSGAVQAYFNNATGKLQCFAGSGTTPNIGLAEPNSVNLSGQTYTILAFGY